jgi:hypothetical protein
MGNTPWGRLARNTLIYIATIAVLIVLMRLRLAYALPLLWLVGLSGAGVLVYQFTEFLLYGPDEAIRIKTRQLDKYLDQALTYKWQIDHLLKDAPEEGREHYLKQQIDTWTTAIKRLIERLDRFYQDEVIRRDLAEVPKAIADLERRLTTESDPTIRAQLQRTLTSRKQQLVALETLQNTIKRAEIQIESTVSRLGTIYSQLLTSQSTSQVADYSRLAENVDEEVQVLQEQLEALREVKLGAE